MTLTIDVARSAPRDADAVGIPVASEGTVSRSLGLTRARLAELGFEGKPGQTLVIPTASGATVIAIGVGARKDRTPAAMRNAAAALARAAAKCSTLATSLADVDGEASRATAQAVAEGLVLASYRFTNHKSDKPKGGLSRVVLLAGSASEATVRAGAQRGSLIAGAVTTARDLANTPPAYLTARHLAERAEEIAAANGLEIEVFGKDELERMGCGGMLGVNQGSVEPPRLVKLVYRPRNPSGHVALVGKGVMYDSGGISLKPSDGMHVMMKMDMSGAAAVLAAMSTLKALRCKTQVTGYLCCTDNLPSGSAFKLGDVLTFRNGKTAEIHNTDAEGRLVLADGLSLAVEDKPDAIVDIATLTGAVLSALGTRIAGVLGNDQKWVERVRAAGERVDELMWQLPLHREYRRLLDSNVADMKNVGGPYGGAITAALFLNEFVADVPWAHLDIAGTMNSDSEDGWLSRGATAYGTRSLIELVTSFTRS
ncbi:MAG: leucyl aminopeptidase [Actinomycetota bacterium]